MIGCGFGPICDLYEHFDMGKQPLVGKQEGEADSKSPQVNADQAPTAKSEDHK